MAKLLKKPEVYTSVRWDKLGDHRAVKEPTQAAIDEMGHEGKLAAGFCPHCKRPFMHHGSMHITNGNLRLVCPGDWLVSSAGLPNIYTEEDIHKEFNVVAE